MLGVLEAILMSILNILLFYRRQKDIPKLSFFAAWPGPAIKCQWLELPIFRTKLHGFKEARAIEFDSRLWALIEVPW